MRADLSAPRGASENRMRKTIYKLLVTITNTQPVYRTVWEQDGHFFVKYNGKTSDVTNMRDKFLRINE